jgi:hypothetical protein
MMRASGGASPPFERSGSTVASRRAGGARRGRHGWRRRRCAAGTGGPRPSAAAATGEARPCDPGRPPSAGIPRPGQRAPRRRRPGPRPAGRGLAPRRSAVARHSPERQTVAPADHTQQDATHPLPALRAARRWTGPAAASGHRPASGQQPPEREAKAGDIARSGLASQGAARGPRSPARPRPRARSAPAEAGSLRTRARRASRKAGSASMPAFPGRVRASAPRPVACRPGPPGARRRRASATTRAPSCDRPRRSIHSPPPRVGAAPTVAVPRLGARPQAHTSRRRPAGPARPLAISREIDHGRVHAMPVHGAGSASGASADGRRRNRPPRRPRRAASRCAPSAQQGADQLGHPDVASR